MDYRITHHRATNLLLLAVERRDQQISVSVKTWREEIKTGIVFAMIVGRLFHAREG